MIPARSCTCPASEAFFMSSPNSEKPQSWLLSCPLALLKVLLPSWLISIEIWEFSCWVKWTTKFGLLRVRAALVLVLSALSIYLVFKMVSSPISLLFRSFCVHLFGLLLCGVVELWLWAAFVQFGLWASLVPLLILFQRTRSSRARRSAAVLNFSSFFSFETFWKAFWPFSFSLWALLL